MAIKYKEGWMSKLGAWDYQIHTIIDRINKIREFSAAQGTIFNALVLYNGK